MEDSADYYTYDIAIKRYKMALLTAMTKPARGSEQAYLCLKLAWLYRGAAEELQQEVQRAKDAGIKIIAYDRLLQNTDIDLYISFDNERVGTMMGEALVENGLAGGNVLMLGGSAVDSNVAMVEKGFRKVMEDNQVTILDSMHADGWKQPARRRFIL